MNGAELLTGHHSDLAYNVAKEIAEALHRGDMIHARDMTHVRGIIQIHLEKSRQKAKT